MVSEMELVYNYVDVKIKKEIRKSVQKVND